MKTIILILAVSWTAVTAGRSAPQSSTVWEAIYDVSAYARLERLKELIKEGTDINAAVGYDRMTREGAIPNTWPLDLAVQQGQVQMVEFLLANGAVLHGEEIAAASMARNLPEVLAMTAALLKAGADPNSPGRGTIALLTACNRGMRELVDLLLAHPGIRLNDRSSDGETALIAAARGGHQEILEMLLAAGADPALANARGETAITVIERNMEKQKAMISRLQSKIK